MPNRRYTPTQQAKRDKAFRERLAKKENPIRYAMALPVDIKLDEISWEPSHLEQIAAKLADLKKKWEADDDKRRRKRLAEILEAVKRDGL